MSRRKGAVTIEDIAMVGIMLAVIEVCKFALSSMPNIELTSFWIIMFTLCFGWRVLALVPALILLEGSLYGVHVWWIMYLYAWPILVAVTWILRKHTSAIFWAVVSGTFGLCFGALCSIPYFFIGLSSGGVSAGIRSAFVWWIAGIPWDLIHCGGNFVLMLVLHAPIMKAMKMAGRRS